MSTNKTGTHIVIDTATVLVFHFPSSAGMSTNKTGTQIVIDTATACQVETS